MNWLFQPRSWPWWRAGIWLTSTLATVVGSLAALDFIGAKIGLAVTTVTPIIVTSIAEQLPNRGQRDAAKAPVIPPTESSKEPPE